MQRRRSTPHTFEDNIAAEKARLEAQAADLRPGPKRDRSTQKDQAAGDRISHERVAFVPQLTAPNLTD